MLSSSSYSLRITSPRWQWWGVAAQWLLNLQLKSPTTSMSHMYDPTIILPSNSTSVLLVDCLFICFYWTHWPYTVSTVLSATTNHAGHQSYLWGAYQPLSVEICVTDHTEWKPLYSGNRHDNACSMYMCSGGSLVWFGLIYLPVDSRSCISSIPIIHRLHNWAPIHIRANSWDSLNCRNMFCKINLAPIYW